MKVTKPQAAGSSRTLLTACFWGLALTALPLQARAMDFTPDPARILSDPAYLPMQNQISGTTAYTYSRTTADVDNNAGALSRSFKTDSSDATQTFAYGVTDDFTLRASEAYDWNKTHNEPAAGSETTTAADGFVDPTFGATWRVLDQKNNPLNWDLIGAYAPNLIDAKGASPTQDGSVARGGQMATMETALSYKTKDFTIYTDGAASYLGKRDIINTNSTTTDYKSSWQYVAALTTQTRLSDVFSVNAGVSETFNTKADAENEASSLSFTSKPGDVTTLSAALNYHIIPNKLVASFVYNYDIHANSSSTYSTVPADNTSTTDDKENVFTARIAYAF